MKRFWLGLCLLVIYLSLASCGTTRVLLKTASNTPKGAAATPEISNTLSYEQWESQKPLIRTALETEVYGNYPDHLTLSVMSERRIAGTHFGNRAHIEHHRLSIHNPNTDASKPFNLLIVKPAVPRQTPIAPIIIMQSFCPAHDVIPEAGLPPPPDMTFSCAGSGFANNVFGYFFGRYIRTPPIEAILDAGFSFAVMYPPEFIPDNAQAGINSLGTYFSSDVEHHQNKGQTRAIAAWAKQYALVANHLKDQADFSKTILYGHSRYGKTALVAMAFDENIDAAIAHQSGTGGASLSRDKPGETVQSITTQYPHWFSPAYKEENLTYDQHHLLALIAPRPILLGNASRDVWSDPNGGFLAAQGATPVYRLYGKLGLTQEKLKAFAPDADIAFWMRPGTHGVVKEDWLAFLDFLNAKF